jgi:hypothetical protein
VTTLVQRRLHARDLAELAHAPAPSVRLEDDQRRTLAERFRAVSTSEHRRLDAWLVERAGRPSGAFAWTPVTARRTIGAAALRRCEDVPGLPAVLAVRDALDDLLARAAARGARPGSLASWLVQAAPAVRDLVCAEALGWTLDALLVQSALGGDWRATSNDAFYDVAGARTTLRGRRDLASAASGALVRLRAGAPGPSAGPGLRADLLIATLAHPEGLAPSRLIGVWPDAGVVLSVDASLADLRAGARDLVRTAVALRRQRLVLAA